MRRIVILVMCVQLGGCYTEYGPVVTDMVPLRATRVAARLEPGDQLKIVIFGEDALSGTYEISPAGLISMPLIGSIPVSGRTPAEVEGALVRAYARGKFLQEPKIIVSVVSYRPVYVFGEVMAPGQYDYTAGLDVLGAVATAGGFTYRASKSTVLIRHAGELVWQEYSLTMPISIQPGDLIRIPERYF